MKNVKRFRRFAASLHFPFSIFHFSFLILAFFSVPLAAQDQVILQTEGTSSRLTLPCQIVDYTGERITVQFKTGATQKMYPSEQVIEVRTAWLESHELGRKLLAERKLADAARALQSALIVEKRGWVQREILASLIRCSIQSGDRASAGTRFLKLLESDRTTRHFGLIPLVWASEQVSSAAKSQAQVWLTMQESDTARLLGASLLLDDASLGDTAAEELQKLQRGTDDRIRSLAQAQSWRLKLRALEIGDIELNRWDVRIRELPAPLRGGPSYLLGRGWSMRREHDRAATSLLWVTLMDDSDPRLAARAGVEAAESLKRLGQSDDARRLLQEIATRFPDTEFGEAAK
ncbi:MAG: tetratricopeptide repeat protein [Planctomycetaceae bacterium]